MKTHHSNNWMPFLFLALVGSGLFLLLNRQQSLPKKTSFPMENPAVYRPKEPAQSFLRMMPHPPGTLYLAELIVFTGRCRITSSATAWAPGRTFPLTCCPETEPSLRVSAMLEGSEIHPVRQYHGTLYIDNET
jgi:hypothetical protein